MPKQQNLPGVGPKEIPELSAAALRLRELRKNRMELANEEEKAQADLDDLCKTHRATKSRPYIMEIDGDDGETIRLDVFRDTPASRAYVRIHKEPKKDEEEEGVEENSEE
jgi:hypothetical protein